MRAILAIGALLWGVAASAGPCPNRFLPIERGLSLLYRAGAQPMKVDFEGVKADQGHISAQARITYNDRTGQTVVSCGPEGIAFQLGGIEAAALSATGLDVEVISSQGVLLLPEAQLVPGATWKSSVQARIRPPKGTPLPFSGEAVLSTELDKQSTVIGPDRVTVLAGTFDALKIKNVTTAKATHGPGRSVESTVWIAPGVGIVKIQTGNTVDFELVGIERAHGGKAPKARSLLHESKAER